jgi:lipopolysaccharide/colanic/teichoic acid biosynthesis glycosyltransferase
VAVGPEVTGLLSTLRRRLGGAAPADAEWAGCPHESHVVLPAPMFLRLLSVERKRSERSRQPFVLMLIERPHAGSSTNGHGRPEPALCELLPSIRETDIAGWYKNGALGVIFAELGAGDKASIIEALQARMTAALRAGLGPDAASQVRVSFHWFPEDWSGRGTNGETTATLYPDLDRRQQSRKISLAMKRAVDAAGSAVLLLILSPVLLAVAVAIRLTSAGPIIFRQQRVGQHGVPFTFLKFRSMYAASDQTPHEEFIKKFITQNASNNGVYKLTTDARVTPVGRFIRRTSIDELPQLFNVLIGEMSLVGPRPPICYELEAYDLWHRRRVVEAKPGITGLWQVAGRSRLRFDDMVRLDLAYARGWSLWLDFKILLRTARVVLSGAGAY